VERKLKFERRGQSALILIYMACLSSGDHVLVPESVDGPSRAFADQVLRRYGVGVEYYPPLEGQSLVIRIPRQHSPTSRGVHATLIKKEVRTSPGPHLCSAATLFSYFLTKPFTTPTPVHRSNPVCAAWFTQLPDLMSV
jgi:hypothetical protein